MNKLVLSVLVVLSLSGSVKGSDVGITGGAGEPLSAATKRLFNAVITDNVDQIMAALAAGADVNARDSNGWTPLHFAAMNGDADAVRALRTAGAEVNARGYDGYIPLHLAARSGDLPVVQYLLAAGAKVNAKIKAGATPLQFAASFGNLDVVQYLLALPQVDLTLTNNLGETAQEQARRCRRDEIADRIGAEIENRRRWSPLRKAFIGVVVGAELNAARDALDALLAEGDGAPTSAAGGGGGSAGAADDADGTEEHKGDQ